MNLRNITKTQIKTYDDIFNIKFKVNYGRLYIRVFNSDIEKYTDKELAMFCRTSQYYENVNLDKYINVTIYNKLYVVKSNFTFIAVLTEKNTLVFITTDMIKESNKELYNSLMDLIAKQQINEMENIIHDEIDK